MLKLVAYGLLGVVVLTAAEDIGLVPQGRYLNGVPRWHLGPHLQSLAEEGAARAGRELEDIEPRQIAAVGSFTARITARAKAGSPNTPSVNIPD